MVTHRALCAWWLALWCRPHHQKASGGFLVTSQNMLPSARDAFWTLAKAPCGVRGPSWTERMCVAHQHALPRSITGSQTPLRDQKEQPSPSCTSCCCSATMQCRLWVYLCATQSPHRVYVSARCFCDAAQRRRSCCSRRGLQLHISLLRTEYRAADWVACHTQCCAPVVHAAHHAVMYLRRKCRDSDSTLRRTK